MLSYVALDFRDAAAEKVRDTPFSFLAQYQYAVFCGPIGQLEVLHELQHPV